MGSLRCGSSRIQKELLEHFKSPTFNRVTSIKSFDFSTLYTTIPHQKLKDRLTSIIRNAFIFKNGKPLIQIFGIRARRNIFCEGALWFQKQVLWRWHHQDAWVSSWQYFSWFLPKKVFQQTVGIPMGKNCAPLLADIFLYSYQADFVQSLLSTGKKHLASRFNFTYRYIRWCIVHKQLRIRTLSGPDVCCWTWDQRHHREHKLLLLI